MKTPLVSVVIPTYNRAKDLSRALASVRAQSFNDWEAIVVDNHSTDNTNEIIEQLNDQRIKLFKVHNNGIIAVSRNLGIRQASGKYVAFLDSDDWWKKEKLEESVKYLSAGAAVVYHDLYLVHDENQKWFFKKTHTRDLNTPVLRDLLINGNPLSNSSVVVAKDFLEQIGGLSEESSLVAIEDFDAWLKIANITEKFKKIPKTLGYYWVGGGNVSNPARLLKNVEALRSKYEQVIKNLKIEDRVYWFDYAKARAHFILGSYKEAEGFLSRVSFYNAPLTIFLKKYAMIFLIKWNLREKN